MANRVALIACVALGLFAAANGAAAAELLVGTATADITPPLPVSLAGQFHQRVTSKVETPLTANVVALESREAGRSLDAAVMVSCDLVGIPEEILEMVRQDVHKRLPDLDTKKVFLNAVHNHTGPVLSDGQYPIPKTGVTQVGQYRALLAERIGGAVARAWKARQPGSVTWGLSHAVVAHNRRSVYANGTAQMYGRTDSPEFRNLEGCEDHDIGTLFFWNQAGKLLSIVVDVSCTAQEVEGRSTVHADFCDPLRAALHKRYGADVCVLTWIGAAGDQSPHLMYRRAADDRMGRLRGLDRLEEIARRLACAVNDAYEVVKNDRHADVPLVHKVETLRLPMRLVTEAEYAEAKAVYQQAQTQIAKNPKAADQAYARLKWQEATVQRFEKQKANPKPTWDMELHVLRIGDAVVCTNPFELFTDYGICIKARSKAVQTFVVQLAAGLGGYLPTERAVRGGGYSAIVQSGFIGPEGGQIFVDRTVALIDALWAKPGQLRAGVSRIDSTPPAFPVSLVGSFNDRKAQSAHDPLSVRSLVLDNGRERVAIAVADICLLPRELCDEARRRASAATGIRPDRILIAGTHTHSAPPTAVLNDIVVDPAYPKFLTGKIVEAIEQAARGLTPAKAGWGVAQVPDEVFNRRWIMKEGTVPPNPFGGKDRAQTNPGVNNPNLDRPAGPTDPDVSVLSLQSATGQPLVLLANYSLHYVGDVPGGLVSADYFGEFCRQAEARLAANGAKPLAILTNGTSGDVNNIDFREARKPGEAFSRIRHVAGRVADAALSVQASIKPQDCPVLAMAERELELAVRKPNAAELERAQKILAQPDDKGLPRLAQYYAKQAVRISEYPDKMKIKLQAIRVGDLGIVAIPCEVFAETGLEIKKRSPLKPTFTIELANGYHGYLPTPEQHAVGGYETWPCTTSYLEVDASRKIAAALLELLGQVAKVQ